MDIDEARERIDRWFPNLAAAGYELKSDQTVGRFGRQCVHEPDVHYEAVKGIFVMNSARAPTRDREGTLCGACLRIGVKRASPL